MSAIYLEDSFVLGIEVSEKYVRFALDLVLTTDPPEYQKPPSDERFCYRRGLVLVDGAAAEQNFLTHDLTEAELMKEGVPQDKAHDMAHDMAGDTHRPLQNYDPSVIRAFPEYFNSELAKSVGVAVMPTIVDTGPWTVAIGLTVVQV